MRVGRHNQGFAILELMITMLVLVITVQAFTVFMQNVFTKNVKWRDKVFAGQKAVQILEEMRSLVLHQDNSDISVLDGYGDNDKFYYTLTTDPNVIGRKQYSPQPSPHDNMSVYNDSGPIAAPLTDFANNDKDYANDLLSGNILSGTKGYKFVRHVRVEPVLNEPRVRKVWVQIFYAKENLGPAETGPALPSSFGMPPLAEVYTVLETVGKDSPPTQVMDVYLVVIENVPGWWVRPADLRPMVAGAVLNLQSRNPGLLIRERWIRRMSFGRDREYMPEINTDSVLGESPGAFAKTYMYPGYIDYDDGFHHFFMDPFWIQGRMQWRIDPGSATETEIHRELNYSLADSWNHAVRYPEELEIYNKLTAVMDPPPEVSYRMLWEGMNSGNPKYRNSIILNLHGELVPLVPLRNYSDAAKDPEEFYYVGSDPVADENRAYRAVTHFEKLHFDSSTDEVAARVYAYNALPDKAEADAAFDPYNETVDITLFVPGATFANIEAANPTSIQRMIGLGESGVAGANKTYGWENVGQWYDPLTATASFGLGDVYEIDEYTPVSRSAGLRIRLYGVSTTARACVDCPL